MKVQSQQTEVLRSNITQEQNFTIKASSKAFEILSSGLYANKILAIVRELSCNAWDSHIAAGKSDHPIEIKLPSNLDNTFYVKDYGTGLSHDQICTLYTTYFDSTKTDSNDFIGALGLGSKAPFSYVSNFIVESRQNGINRIYSCFKNEHNLPSISLLSEIETEEENGMTIRLTTLSKDIDNFKHAAKTALMYFDPKPNVVGQPNFEPYYVKHTLSGSNWKLRETDYYSFYKGPRVVQGFISYPIDYHILEQHDLSDTAKVLLKTNIDLYVNIGEVDIAASREALSYDPRTITNLVKHLEQISTEVRTSIQAQFDVCKSKWATCLLFDDLTNNQGNEFGYIFKTFNNVQPFTWNNEFVSGYYPIDINLLRDVHITTFNLLYDKIRLQRTTNEVKPVIEVSKHLYVIFDPYHRSREIYRKELTNARRKGISKPYLLVIRPNKKGDMIPETLKSLLEIMDNPEYTVTSPITKQKTQTTRNVGVTRSKESKLYWKGFRIKKYYNTPIRKFSHLCWNNELVDMSEGGIYVPIHSNAVIFEKNQYLNFDLLLEHCIKIGVIKSDTKIYGLTDKDQKQIKTTNWINLFDLISENFKINHDVYINSLLYAQLPMIHEYNQRKLLLIYMIDNWDSLKQDYDNNFGKFVSRLRDIRTQSQNINGDSILWISKSLKLHTIVFDMEYIKRKLILDWQSIHTKQYPILDIINWPNDINLVQNTIQKLQQYFTLVDNQNKINDNNI